MEHKYYRRYDKDVQLFEQQKGAKINFEEKKDIVSHIIADLSYVPKAEQERRMNAVATRRKELYDDQN